jgi:uncharacterized protein (DUF934 family)
MLRVAARLALAIAIVLPLAAISAAANGQTVKAPKAGSQYRGKAPRDVIIRIARRSIEIVAFSFPCGKASGRTALNGIKLKRTRRGFRFKTRAFGNVTYSDQHADENARIDLSGRFAPNAKTVRGHVRVKSPRCGTTGYLRLKAKR